MIAIWTRVRRVGGPAEAAAASVAGAGPAAIAAAFVSVVAVAVAAAALFFESRNQQTRPDAGMGPRPMRRQSRHRGLRPLCQAFQHIKL